jgi:hypothetical protein
VGLPARDNVLLAPRSGLDVTGKTPRALLPSGETVDVKLGPCNTDTCVVLSGLDAGTRLRGGG